MLNRVSAVDLSSEELELLVLATAAYQHNERYREIHRKLSAQLDAMRALELGKQVAKRRPASQKDKPLCA